MAYKALQQKIAIAIILTMNLGINTYAHANSPSNTNQQLETINLMDSLLEPEIDDLIKRQNSKKIPLNSLRATKKVIKQKNLSKKFGPLLVGFKVRSFRRAAIGFNIDLIETLDILAQRDPKLFLKTDEEHYILSPQTKEEVFKTINLFKSKFHLGEDTQLSEDVEIVSQ